MYDDKRHFRMLYDKTPGEFSFERQGDVDIAGWQTTFRTRLIQKLGIERINQDFSGFIPVAELVNCEKRDGYSLERWTLSVEPEIDLPFYVLRPTAPIENIPLVITPHGHNRPGVYVRDELNKQEEQSIQEGDRDIAVQAVQQGYLVIAPTARGFGDTRFQSDRKDEKLSSCRNLLVQDLLVGRTPIGDRVYDISRLIDWALATQKVDPRRIAITGNSGGGTISLFAPACDTRIQVAVPSSYFCTFTGSIGSIFHCECNYVPGILELGEMYDIAGLIAPRPFCAICGRYDEIFPIKEAELAFQRLKKIYKAAGAPDNCQLFIGEGGHRYYKEPAWEFIRTSFYK